MTKHRNHCAGAVVRRASTLAVMAALGGCSLFVPREPAPPPLPPPPPPPQEPLATHTFPFDPEATGVVGELQVTYARYEDTIPDIARRFNLGFDEVARANPGVDPWLPGEGTRIILPTQFVLPDAPPEGVVINVAALRSSPKPDKDGQRVVITYRSASARSAGPRRSDPPRWCRSAWDPCGFRPRRYARSMRRTTTRCPLECRPAPTIRSAPTR
jgi:hypothetical protein